MRFFKRALKTSAYVVSPAISIWVLTYQIPSTLITLWGNETEPTNAESYNQAGHAMIALTLSAITGLLACISYNECYSDDECVNFCERENNNDSEGNYIPIHPMQAIGNLGDHLLEDVTSYGNK